ncbi:glycosyltransferase [Porphyrobacter sp. AAP60]|uniref:glycosyltransferase n=1 Tax=Porphyrobacter sp. AAP60 TaxID=1523423 RepID=UPI0006B9516A|nr:glycosyltransferase [Porphyrobacter sp. AAP60]
MRIAVLFDRFGPYHVARLRGAMAQAEVLAVEGAPHRAVYDWTPPDLPNGLDHVALTDKAGEESDPVVVEARLEERVGRWKPDVIALPGWSNMVTLCALRWARRAGIAAVCMSETNAWDFERKSLTENVKRGIVAHYGGGLATNRSQIEYLAQLGVPREAIFGGYNAIDNDFFREAAARWRATPGLPPEIEGAVAAEAHGQFFLASNRFIPKKNLLRLLDAYAAFRKRREADPADWPLILLGDGELRGEIEAKIAALGLGSHVHLPGFLQLDALVRYYGTAGAFIHASTTEQWGLVINEAMAAGLPVAASNRCGSTHYLIDDGITGFSFDPHSTEDITAALGKLAQLPSDAPLLEAARAKVEQLRPEGFGEGLHQAASAARSTSARPGVFARLALDLAIARAARAERG